ncbi:MAG: hypothetical protein ACK58N_12130 [Synechocystis sp.]|jgi:hypothetical protein
MSWQITEKISWRYRPQFPSHHSGLLGRKYAKNNVDGVMVVQSVIGKNPSIYDEFL